MTYPAADALATTGTRAGPALSVTGVNKAWAGRAIKWMRDRSLLAYYNPRDKSLNAFEFKQGAAWTDNVMRKALDSTR